MELSLDKKTLQELIHTNYTSKNGSFKIKLMPESIKEELQKYTKQYILNELSKHWSVRCYLVVNDLELTLCNYCNGLIQPSSIMQYNNQKFCSTRCTNLGTKQVRQETCIKKYGVADPNQLNVIKQKITNTHLDRYGATRASATNKFIESRKQTCLEKYGVINTSQLIDNRLKAKATSIKRYNVSNYSKSDEFKSKSVKTFLKNYGVSNPSLDPSIIQKIQETTLSRYGNISYMKSLIDNATLEILDSKEKFIEFATDKTVIDISTLLCVNPKTIHNRIIKYDCKDIINTSRSSIETSMLEFLQSLGINIIQSYREIIPPFELDFYLPDYNIAIEMNGLYWHSDTIREDKNYHYNKWKMCNENGIHLLSIWEDDWKFQTVKIKNYINSLIGNTCKGAAGRKCNIKQIIAADARLFVDTHHIQNFVGGTHHFGAFYNNQLVGVMTFGYTRNNRFELKRWVTDNTTHPGLFSKTLKYAQTILQFDHVVSFSDNSYFTGNMYEKSGFKLQQMLPVSYKYLYNGKLVHKRRFTKKNIIKMFPTVDPLLTETQAMQVLNIPRVYDCGKKEWRWKLNEN